MIEADNILRILRESRTYLKEGNSNELKKLSDQTIHSASLSQDPDNIIVAVLVYSIGKLIERPKYREIKGWDKFYNSVIKNLDNAIKHLDKKEIDKCRNHLGKIRNSINEISGNLRFYIKDVFRKAEINKAFRMYEHGISSERTAELLGISLWDLSTYIGQSSVSDSTVAINIPIRKRIKMTESFFG